MLSKCQGSWSVFHTSVICHFAHILCAFILFQRPSISLFFFFIGCKMKNMGKEAFCTFTLKRNNLLSTVTWFSQLHQAGCAGGLNALSGQQTEEKIKTLLEVSYYCVKDEMECLLISRKCQKIEVRRLWGCWVCSSFLCIGREESSAVSLPLCFLAYTQTPGSEMPVKTSLHQPAGLQPQTCFCQP